MLVCEMTSNATIDITKPFTIAHISDLHISLDHQRQNIRRTRRLLESALHRNVDHIVVTGDITADAKPGEFDSARKIFKNYGLLDSKRLTVVAGNHDIFGGVHTAEEIFSFPKRCKGVDYGAKLNLFRGAFEETFRQSLIYDRKHLFPFVKILGGVMLIGVNSVAGYSKLANPLGSNGEIDDKQFKQLNELLGADLFRNKRKIVLIHHHFNKLRCEAAGTIHSVWSTIEKQTMKLRGKKRLLELFRKSGVQLVLHGHVHENREYEREGIQFVNSGGSVLGGERGTLSYTLVHVYPDTIRTTLQNISMDPAIHPAIPAVGSLVQAA